MKAAKKPRRPTEHQTSWLRRIAQSGLMVTRTPEAKDAYSLMNGEVVPEYTAKILIREGWVKGDGDGLFEQSQTYRCLKP